MKELNSQRVFFFFFCWYCLSGKSSSFALCLIYHQNRCSPGEAGETQEAVLRKQRLQSAEGTAISLCQSETRNCICSLNSLCNFVSRIYSSVSVSLCFAHSVTVWGVIPFFASLYLFHSFLPHFIYFPLLSSIISCASSCFPDLFRRKQLGCIVAASLRGLLL